ncbi:N-acetylmuramic acid 6-phosphate etherase [Psychromicrobium xiongbiense]|uniref:N-acetylmuramic acid 6-phosphate etherase n=1 Tax=Psychromicrobium xiongbiense TaxID=3051184 RepID=UPI0025577FA8|nr:N-acetylmuramic acid 6-phosphate etherase [Psychromicrobium sp. YIM S02556]
MSLSSEEITTLTGLSTEAADDRYSGIDRMSVAELAATMNQADASVPAAVERALPSIVPAIEAAAERMERGGRLIYVGAGSPGRIGILDASECPPTYGTSPETVFAIMAGGTDAFVTPIEGAEDDALAGAAEIDAAGVGPLDTVVGIAASGRTPFVVAAVSRARELGAAAVGLSCNPGSALSASAEYPIEVVVGPEVVSGSTRLKAGTAQKLVLNMFSTIVMVRLGKTYGNLMVDVKATNLKLVERAARIVCTITGVSREQGIAALEANDFSVKRAVVQIRLGVDAGETETLMARAGGRLRRALGEDVDPDVGESTS